jgi:hypothetical protein
MLLTQAEAQRITGQFSPEFLERLRNAFLVEQIEAAVQGGKIPAEAYASKLHPIGGGAVGFYITNAEAQSMLTDYFVGVNAGTAAVIQIRDGSVPADADTALGAQVLLATLTCAATAQASIGDDTPGAIATFDTITSDASADATGTASFFRILTQTGGTVVAQGTVGTATSDLILNTVAITSGSTVSISAATILLPEGP